MRKQFLCISSKTSLSHFFHIQISYLKLGSVGNGNVLRSQLTVSCSSFFLSLISVLSRELPPVLLLETVEVLIDFRRSSDLLISQILLGLLNLDEIWNSPQWKTHSPVRDKGLNGYFFVQFGLLYAHCESFYTKKLLNGLFCMVYNINRNVILKSAFQNQI